MNIVITGSLGHISRPLTKQLVEQGHQVTVISSKESRKIDIEKLNAKAAIGSIENVSFLAKTFTGADIVYLMEPPINFFDHDVDIETYWTNIAKSYSKAIEQAGITKVIHLSSIGAHAEEGVGMLVAHYEVEKILNALPTNVAIKFMRPVGFYYNIFAFMHSLKTQGNIVQNYGGDKKEPWVSPLDIADVIVEEIKTAFNGRTIRYIASDEVSPNEIAQILGKAIGKPDLKWDVITDKQFLSGLIAAGFGERSAKGLTEMNAARRNHLYDDYERHRPILGKIKLTDFAEEFAIIFNQQ